MGNERHVCINCGAEKVLPEFYVRANGRPYSRCKPCYNQWTYEKHGKAYAQTPQVKSYEANTREKACIECRRILAISEFYVKERRKRSTHYFSRCKRCYYRWVYLRDKANGYIHHGGKQRNGPCRLMLRREVKAGRIEKPSSCGSCGAKVERKSDLHGHHPDHSKPFHVEWLCRPCHRIAERT